MSPYISPKQRIKVAVDGPGTAGEIAFTLYDNCKRYLHTVGHSYQSFADVLAALRICELELYEHVIKQHENKKRREHGDV